MTNAITISRTHKVNGKDIRWASEITVTESAGEIIEQDGVRMFKTNRNYYYGAKSDGKLHWERMSAENSSAQWYADFYIELKEGVYIYSFIATDSNVESKMASIIGYVKNLDAETIDNLTREMLYIK